MKILIIIPAYNESENIENVIKNLHANNALVDYVIINDCSKDNTKELCQEKGFNIVNLPVNLGIGGGVQTGYLYAYENGYDIAIQMDGDGQHNPAYINSVIEPIIKGEADIAIGSRFVTKEGFQSTGLRRFGISLLSTVIRICSGVVVKDVTSGFRAVNREFIKYYADNYAQDYPEPEAIVAAAMQGCRIKEVPVIMEERQGGTSSITALKSVYYMMKVSMAIVLQRMIVQRGKKK